MISDAAAAVNVETHVLRYWEDELGLLVPRNEMGHRYYTRENIQEFQKIKELKEKLDLTSQDIQIMDDLLESYKLDRKQFEAYQNTPVPIAERIIKDENGVRLLSKEKYDKTQNLFYVKELGVGYIRREEYEKAIAYYLELLDSDFLYYRYHAYKQFARILRNMKDPDEFRRILDNLK